MEKGDNFPYARPLALIREFTGGESRETPRLNEFELARGRRGGDRGSQLLSVAERDRGVVCVGGLLRRIVSRGRGGRGGRGGVGGGRAAQHQVVVVFDRRLRWMSSHNALGKKAIEDINSHSGVRTSMYNVLGICMMN